MLAILEQIIQVIQVLFSSVVSLFASTAMLVSRIPEFLLFLNGATAALPSVIVPFILFGFTISFLLLLLGRN